MNANVIASENPPRVQDLPDAAGRARSRGSAAACGVDQRRERRRQAIEAVVAADLLDEVDLARDVDAEASAPSPASRSRRSAVDAEPERLEDARHVVRRHVLPEQPRDPRGAERDAHQRRAGDG